MGNCLKKFKNTQQETDNTLEYGNEPQNVVEEPALTPVKLSEPPDQSPALTDEEHYRSYDKDALSRMRWQLQHDSDAFLLNNILLSVQFFENYERETYKIKKDITSDRENLLNEAMEKENKQVFFADRLQECVYEHVYYQRNKGAMEPLSAPRLFVIYDNVKASEPGDTLDHSEISNAPLYKLLIEDDKEPGYIKLRKIEVLEHMLHKETISSNPKKLSSYDSIYSDSEKEGNDSDTIPCKDSRGEQLKSGMKLRNPGPSIHKESSITSEANELSNQTAGEPTKEINLEENKNVSEIKTIDKDDIKNTGENSMQEYKNLSMYDVCTMLPKKSILKNTRIFGESVCNKPFDVDSRKTSSNTNVSDETETSGYISGSSRKRYSSETESNYSFSASTGCVTPKKVELSMKNYHSVTSGVLPEEGWTPLDVLALDDWMDEGDDEIDDEASSSHPTRFFYLNPAVFMNNFIDNFIIHIGPGLGFAPDAINSALTQGASIYCDYLKNSNKVCYEIFPALAASWPNAANQWIVRKRKIRRDPRTKFTYQWPRQDMVTKTINTSCFLIPIGVRSQKGLNTDETLQWKLTFPEAESYLESCLAHSHMRCYLFTLVLHKTFMENETAKIGIDASHIKNHLFWQCEHNYAKWPEDRLGETLRLFLQRFYVNFARSRMPNYFIENCNVFKGIPKISKVQKRLADILETPVMHLLSSLENIKYTKGEYYPAFNSQRLYDILTCKNPLRLLNPNIPLIVKNYASTSETDDFVDDNQNIIENKIKAQDKNYQLKKRLRQIQEKKKVQMQSEIQKLSTKQNREMNRSYVLPVKMDPVRRRLVLEFFVPHFIAMAESSKRFEAMGQAIIYLDQAHRLCLLLLEESGADVIANDYLNDIRVKLTDYRQMLVQRVGQKFPSRRVNYLNSSVQSDHDASALTVARVADYSPMPVSEINL